MEEGALGMSSGLTYTPGMYASTDELSVLCSHLSKHFPGSFYAPHHRSYGKGCLDAYKEMLDLGRETGVAVHLTHATMNFAENKGRAQELLDIVDEARGEGVDVSLDTYPYLPGSTTLVALLPSWASQGGPEETLMRLNDKEVCERMRVDIEIKGSDGGHGLPVDWSEIEIASVGDSRMIGYQGKTIADIAKREGRLASQVFFDILKRDKLRTSILMHVGDEENVRTIMRHEVHCGGSDG
jgi:N-acyl-D-amino-acid deacylase